MVKVIFTATKSVARYSGNFTATDGQIVEVSESEAKRLVADYPDNFAVVEAKPPKDKISSTKKMTPKKNRSLKPKKDR